MYICTYTCTYTCTCICTCTCTYICTCVCVYLLQISSTALYTVHVLMTTFIQQTTF